MKNPWDRYQARVQAYDPAGSASDWVTSRLFQPIANSCGNCLVLQVTPPATCKQLLDHYRRLLLFVRRTRDGAQFHMSVDYEEKTVIGYLEPGVEYCVTVSMATYSSRKSAPAESCCAFTSPPRTSGSVHLILSLLAVFCLLFFVLLGLLVFTDLSSRLLHHSAAARREAIPPAPFNTRQWVDYVQGQVVVLFTITITMENLLTFITMLCCAPKGLLGVLEGPRQVLMTSYNMDMVLRWDPPLGGAPQLVYTTEYNTTVNSYKPGCTKTRVLHCDFIAVGIHVSPYGTYTGRVRAHRGLESSAWVESGPLTLDVHTVIGPPNVTLYSSGVHMTVNMGDPVFRISQLRRIYNHASYNITYWKEGEEDTAQSLSVQQNPVVLSDLEPWSRYCVKVRIKTERNHQSQESQVTCEKTTQPRAELAPPLNLTMVTMNTQYALHWSHHGRQTIAPKVSFTVHYLASHKWAKKASDPWITVCEKTPDTWCDLTPKNLYFLGLYMLRLRANRGSLHSPWVHKEFCPDKEAALGPPSSVNVAPAGSLLDVKISAPLTSTNGSMRELYTQMYYRVVYWEYTDTRNPDPNIVDTHVNLVTLSELRAWTWYCVSVQSRYDFYNKSSAFTSPHCMQTEGAVPWWQVVLIFLLSVLVVFVVLLLLFCGGFSCYHTVKDTLYPAAQLPLHIQASELICDRFSICTEAVLLEVHMPPMSVSTAPSSGLESDGRHSRQDSGGSTDSGVGSTEGSSGPPRHPRSGLSSGGLEDSWHGPLSTAHLEQVKMEDMGPEPGTAVHSGARDEGIMDMGV
ncbi:hypothetical protein NHX12_006735 [Muraenolepis orangiensis]|uniref:Fibronectin type-III domain-containing protein n=1 Tax=Muraenolepis orangiensis TaxID=630683 RepID=A0A9Q0DS32_9TELE|nr:hypothetical protein NHX12_006735 [Muraenolepis orangiensis]